MTHPDPATVPTVGGGDPAADFDALVVITLLTGTLTEDQWQTIGAIARTAPEPVRTILLRRDRSLRAPEPGPIPERWLAETDRDDPTALLDGFAAHYPRAARPELVGSATAAVYKAWYYAAAVSAPELISDTDEPGGPRALFDTYLAAALDAAV